MRLARSAAYDIVVVHVAPSEPDSIFIDNLRALDAAGLIRLVARYDDEHGVLDVADLDDARARPARAADPRVRTRRAARRAPAPPRRARAHLLTEQFRAATLVVGEGGTVDFTGSGTTVDADGATPILDAAEAAGVLMPSGCRMGICFGCVLPLREGAVRDLRTGAVTTATPGETEGQRRPDPDLHLRRRRRLRHRPLTHCTLTHPTP